MYLQSNKIPVGLIRVPSMTFVNIAWQSQTPVSHQSESGSNSTRHKMNKVTAHQGVTTTMMMFSVYFIHLWSNITHAMSQIMTHPWL